MEQNNDNYKMVAQTFSGLEEILAGELKQLGANNITKERRAVFFEGDKGFMYKANLCCRTAIRILKPIHEFECPDEQALYEGVKSINWLNYLGVSDTFLIDCIIYQSNINHTHFASLKAKDAIADKFVELKKFRPNVSKINPTIKIYLHINNNHCTLSLDSSGEPLFKRGYRIKTNKAPLNEVMAAGIILLSNWDKKSTFIDPMCGSGTIPIEAAMIANNIPAGYYRKAFGFQTWKDYDENLWNIILNSATDKISEFEEEIIGSDISNESLEIATANIKNARLHKDIRLIKKDFNYFNLPPQKCTIIMNPPYGERLKLNDIIQFYKMIGNTLKEKYSNQNVWIFTADNESTKHIGLKPTKKIKLYNGAIECNFIKFEIYSGSKKTKNDFRKTKQNK